MTQNSSTRCRGVRIRGGAPDSGGDHGGRDLLCGMAATPFGTHAAMAQPHRPTGQMDPRSRGDAGNDLGRNLSDPSPHPLSHVSGIGGHTQTQQCAKKGW